MKTLSTIALMLLSVSAMSATYTGQGKETEFGTETCLMSVESTGINVVIKMMALNQEVATVVSDGDELDFNVVLNSTSKTVVQGEKMKGALTIKAVGKLKRLRPISYRLEVVSSDSFMGSEKEIIDCKF